VLVATQVEKQLQNRLDATAANICMRTRCAIKHSGSLWIVVVAVCMPIGKFTSGIRMSLPRLHSVKMREKDVKNTQSGISFLRQERAFRKQEIETKLIGKFVIVYKHNRIENC